MSKFVVLNIYEGSFDQGFRVMLEIGEDGRTFFKQEITLAPAPNIPRLYQDWQDKYRELGKTRQINIPAAQITNCSVIEDENVARNRFENYLIQWFAQLPFRELQVRIEEKTYPHELIRVIIDTNNIYLKKLPWHLWKLFHNRPQAEFALSAEYSPPSEPLKRPIKILAIFGGSKGLDLSLDRQLLINLRKRGAKVTFLEKPQIKQLSHSLWEQHWDILFFAGHSSSREECNSGEIQINDSESLSLTRLRNALRTAVKNGLKLAIFNSCDGLGLADELSGVKVPQMIVMREPVPDEVARQFLQYFLEDFSQGHSLYLAVRNARERLECMEDKFPCASSLPVICQNPAARPLIWAKKSISLQKIAIVTGVVFGVFLSYLISLNFPKTETFNENIPPQKKAVIADSGDTLENIENRSSWGEKLLINSDSNDDKDAGIQAFKNKNFNQAIEYFHKSLEKQPNDPETLIYLNNAVAKQTSKINLLPVPNNLKSALNACSLPNNSAQIWKIAAPIPINADSHIARDLLRGIAQAQNEINCTGGINGKLLQIMIVDDEDHLPVVEEVANKLVKIPNILGIVGHYSSTSTLEAGKIYDGKIVAVSPTSNAFRKSTINPNGLDFSKWVFRTPPSGVKNLVEYMVDKKGYKKAAVVYVPSRAWSNSTYEEFKNYLTSKGGEIVYKCELNGNFIAENCLENAIKKEAEVMLLLPEINQNTFYKALQIFDANYNNPKKLFLFGGTSMYSDIIRKKGKPAENMVIGMYWHRNDQNPSQFESDALALWNAQINGRTAMSYDATMVIAEGLRRMGNNPTREGLKQILSAENFSAKA
ncbi:MAG: ABC transporter substrate-binding protein [Richelia sp. SL_2_1]|nr:ABC transporter substrate-binding protein [Richelia sp. SM1_7_0]NJO29346.1 ABC transporter substrate-binding protein [Richelia sp. SL_2_1]